MTNARTIIEKDKEHKGFKKYLRSFADFDSLIKGISKDFKFMGPSGTYVFLYIVGEKVIPHQQFMKKYMKK